MHYVKNFLCSADRLLVVILALLAFPLIGNAANHPLASPSRLQEPPFTFPTEALPSRSDCDAYLAEMQSLPPAAELPPAQTDEELNFQIGAENCLLGLVSEGAEPWLSGNSASPVTVTVDDSLAGKICASVQRERSRGSACTNSKSEAPMTMVFRAYPPGEHPYDVVIVDPLRRLDRVQGFTSNNLPLDSQDVQDQGLWIHFESSEPPESLEIRDATGFTIGGFSDQSQRFSQVQAAEQFANELPPEME